MLTLALCFLALSTNSPQAPAQLIAQVALIHEADQSSHQVQTKKLIAVDPLATSKTVTFTFRVSIPQVDFQGSAALFIPAIEPNARVFLRDLEIYSTHTSEAKNFLDSVNTLQPHLIKLPSPLFQNNAKSVDIKILGRPGESVGMSNIWYGSYDDLLQNYRWQYYVKWIGSLVMVVVYLLTGVAAFLFWRSDRTYLSPAWFSGYCLTASAAMFMGLASYSPIYSWPLYLHIAIFIVGLSAIFLVQFVLEKINTRSRRTDIALICIAGLFVLSGLVMYESRLPFRYALFVDVVCLLMGTYAVFMLLIKTIRQPDVLNWVLLGGVTLSFLLGLHSVAVGWWPDFYAESYSMQFTPLPLTITMGWVVIRRYARMRLRTEALNKRLQRRVSRREQELKEAFSKLSVLQREETINEERQRVMRDIHDGLGTQLISTLKLARNGKLTSHEMQGALQQCVDELRFSIESLKPTANELNTVLANYRYQLQPRLQALGIQLDWANQDMPANAFSPSEILQIIRILNEAIANTLKHASATLISITGTHSKNNLYTLKICDNGLGFEVENQSGGEGINSMQQRANKIGALLRLNSSSSGTCIDLVVKTSFTKDR